MARAWVGCSQNCGALMIGSWGAASFGFCFHEFRRLKCTRVPRITRTAAPHVSGQLCVRPTSLKLSPQRVCQPTFHTYSATYPPCLSTNCRRLNVQCELKTNGIVVQSLAIRFPPTLSPNSHTPSLSFLACYLVTSSDVLVSVLVLSFTTRPNSTVAQPLISPSSIYLSFERSFTTVLHPLEINLNTLAACSCMSIERLSESIVCHEGLALLPPARFGQLPV